MKKLFCTLSFLLLLMSCSTDDSANSSPGNYRLKEMQFDATTIKFEYNSFGKLAKTVNNPITILYTYDSQQRLTKTDLISPSFSFYRTNFIYNSAGVCLEAITESQLIGSTLTRRKEIFVFNNNKLVQESMSNWDVASGTWSTPTSLIQYEYDANGYLSKETFNGGSSYTLHTNDSNGNTLETRNYQIRSGAVGFFDYYLYSMSTRVYDTNKNPFVNLNPKPSNTKFDALTNNVLDINITTYDENGAIISANNVNYQYEYNEAGYATKSTSGANVTNYILEIQ